MADDTAYRFKYKAIETAFLSSTFLYKSTNILLFKYIIIKKATPRLLACPGVYLMLNQEPIKSILGKHELL